MSHFILIGGMLAQGSSGPVSLAKIRSYDPDMWSDEVIKLPTANQKPLPVPLSYASVGTMEGAVILCGGYEGTLGSGGGATKSCR